MTASRLPGEWLRRIAGRLLSRPTRETVVLPALADLQHESIDAEAHLATSLALLWGTEIVIGVAALVLNARTNGDVLDPVRS